MSTVCACGPSQGAVSIPGHTAGELLLQALACRQEHGTSTLAGFGGTVQRGDSEEAS
jgi:hypothetical protein